MRKIALLFALAALPLAAPPPPADDVLTALRTYRQALVKKDLATLETIWADDYVFVTGHGQIQTKADRLAEIKSGHSSIGSLTHEDEPTVTEDGNAPLNLSGVTLGGKDN